MMADKKVLKLSRANRVKDCNQIQALRKDGIKKTPHKANLIF